VAPNSLLCADGAVKNLLTHSLQEVTNTNLCIILTWAILTSELGPVGLGVGFVQVFCVFVL